MFQSIFSDWKTGSRVRSIGFLFLALFLVHFPLVRASAQQGGERPRVAYNIEVRLDPEKHQITGKETITWVSNAEEPVSDLLFHLYLNAFKNERTTLMTESPLARRGRSLRKGDWGYVDITSLHQVMSDAGSDGTRVDLKPSLAFIQPDDGNPWDQTVGQVQLAESVQPGQTVTVELEFEARFPHSFSRTGFHQDYLLAAQWFPKLGIYRTAREADRFPAPWNTAGWYCPQYHTHCEFASDFGTYRVSITAPSTHIVGATGKLQSPEVENQDGTTTWVFQQDRVHDFAWTADPQFLVEERTFDPLVPMEEFFSAEEEERFQKEKAWVMETLGLSSEELALRPVSVRLLLQPDHVNQAGRYLKAAMVGLRYYGIWFGAYPYETLTVVDPAFGAGATGGMEYPTFITTGSQFLVHPRGTRPEGVTLHEFAHQFWYGLVANDEFDEAWLDEGITTYTTSRVLEAAYPDRIQTTSYGSFDVGRTPILDLRPDLWSAEPLTTVSADWDKLHLSRLALPSSSILDYFRDLPFLNYLPDVPVHRWAGTRARFFDLEPGRAIRNRSYDFHDSEHYVRAVYVKAPLALMTLENMIGRPAFLKVLREYSARYRFGHPTGDDFLNTLNEVSGQDLSPFFVQMFDTTARVDFEVVSLSSREVSEFEGLFDEVQGDVGTRKTVGPKTFAEARQREKKRHGLMGFGGEEDTNSGASSGQYLNTFVVRRSGSLVLPVTVTYKVEGRDPMEKLWDAKEATLKYEFEDSGRLEWVYVDLMRKVLLDETLTNNVKYREPDKCAARRFSVDVLRWALNMLNFYSNFG